MGFGFIPIKIKDQEFKFTKVNDEIYAKRLDTKTKYEFYLGKKIKSIYHTPKAGNQCMENMS